MTLKELVEKVQMVFQLERTYNIRRRLNPHHPKKDQMHEQRRKDAQQLELFNEVKSYFYDHRDELYKQHTTKEEFNILKMLDGLVQQDLEKAVFND